MAAIALAATMALPSLSGFSAQLYAQDAVVDAPAEVAPAEATPVEAAPADAAAVEGANPDAAQPTASASELLNQGERQLKDKQYEEALATLQQVDAAQLSEGEARDLSEALADAEQAASARREARAAFEQGEAALAANNPSEAVGHYKAAADNKYADAGTSSKAKQQIAVAQSAMKGRKGDMKDLYGDAVADYRAKRYEEARGKFQTLRANNYKPGLFRRSPEDYLKDIRKAAGPAPAQDAQADVVAVAQNEGEPEVAAPEQPAPSAEVVEPGVEAPAPAIPAQPEQVAQPAPQQPAPAQPEQPQAPSQASRLVQEAYAEQTRGNYNTALQLYSQALAADPNNEQARAGYNQVSALLSEGRGGQPNVGEQANAGGGLLDQRRQDILAQQQEIRYNFEAAIERMDAAIRENNYAEAQAALERAAVARAANPRIFPEQQIREFDTTLARAEQRLVSSRQEYEKTVRAEEQVAINEAIAQQRAEADRQRERTISQLTSQARTLIDERRYEEAIGVLDQIVTLDPTNDYAIGVRPLVEDRAVLQQQRRYREDFDRQFERQLNAAEEAKIPYRDILRYPENWPDIAELREQSVALERGVGTVDQQVQQILDRRLPEVRFDNIGFADVIDFLREITGANIFVNWRALEGAGIDRATPVTARLRDVKFSKALETILRDVGGGLIELTYTIDEGIITISTVEELSADTSIEIYDIRDLIINIPDFTDAPDFQIQASQGGRGGGGGGQSLFSGQLGEEEEQEGIRTEIVDQIVTLIQESVDAESWRDNGGSVGSIRELSGQLIVTQTPRNQREVQSLLEGLRETRAIQVTIETRFLTVQRNFLEDVGVDIDFVFNIEDPDKFSPISVGNDSFTFTANPGTGVPGSIQNINPGGSDILGGSSLTVGGTYLDNFGVNLLLRATQAAVNSTLLTAPRVTLFNGQRAYVVVATETAYVSDLNPVVGQSSVGFDPDIGIVQSGVLLDVQATVSADRKYVTLTLRPTLARLVALVPFTFQTAAQTTATQPGGGGNVIIDDNNDPGIATATLQTPIREITRVSTTVSVPDGGTLLLGGQTLAGEIEREAGVPVLSKIPFLKRLFTNRSMAKDEQVLLILVKPTIIIQREAEQRQFPTLQSRVGG